MKTDSLFMEHTDVPAERSAADITSLLVRSGARQISTQYSEGRVVGLRFTIPVGNADRWFDLPARTDPVYRILLQRKPYNSSAHHCTPSDYQSRMRAAAERVGWRQLFRWVQAQLAMIDAGMCAAHEVFLPYLIVNPQGQTMLGAFEEQMLKGLPAPSGITGEIAPPPQ